MTGAANPYVAFGISLVRLQAYPAAGAAARRPCVRPHSSRDGAWKLASPCAAERGFLYGLLATLGMTVLMLIGVAAGLSPMPSPIPIALAHWLLGDLPKSVLLIFGMVAHFLYGGAAGAVLLAVLRERTGILWGLAFGALLWLGMQIVFLPLLGWGLFGSAVTPRIAVATLVLHLVYGAILGWGGTRMRRLPTA